jgi:hypothetical protein
VRSLLPREGTPRPGGRIVTKHAKRIGAEEVASLVRPGMTAEYGT